MFSKVLCEQAPQDLKPTFTVHRPNWIKVCGNTYRLSEFLVVGWQDNDLPEFGKIEQLMMVSHVPIAALTLYDTQGIDRHYHSYAVSSTSQVKIIGIEQFEGYPPVIGHYINSQSQYIVVRTCVPHGRS
jgi:hypothetical protein